MESANVDAALKIIQNVDITSDKVSVNSNQCKRLAERLDGIGKALEALNSKDNENPFLETSAIDQIVTVLKKGEALVLSYEGDRSALQSFLSGAVNSEAFKEVHEELDGLGRYLDLDNIDKSEKLRRSQTEKNKMLNFDSRTDWEEMLPKLHSLIREVAPKTSGRMMESDVKNMEMAITEKFSSAESSVDDLSYLNIPFSAIHTHGEIKELKKLSERKTQRDAHLDGKAVVLKGTWNGCDCAIKEFKSAEMHWNKEERHKEIESLVKLRHPHITQLIGCSENEGKTYVLYEKMDSDLRVLMESRMQKKSWRPFGNRPFSRSEEVSIITQIARGMFYLHKRKLAHGELKCTNVLVKEVGNNHIDVKVADFHCSRQLGQTQLTGKLYKPAHRPRWLPPEAFQHFDVEQPADDLLMKGDVYSFAMTCCEVVTGKYPFDGVYGTKDVEKKVKAGDRPTLPEDLSGDLKSLIRKCWDEEPAKRPSFEEICYVLKVDVVNLSQVQKLFSCFGMASSAEPVAKEWTHLLHDLAIVVASKQEIDNGAKELPHYLKIQPSDLEPVRPLGKGASAEVFEASWIGCKFAVKWLKVEHVIKLRQEVSIMIKLLHPHVIRLVGFSVLSNRCAIVMELMEMSLRDFIDNSSSKQKLTIPFSESEALGIITKLALGMAFLHSRGVAHGDLKCANVLVRNTTTTGRLDVKIVDFGLSQLVGKGSSEKPSVVGWWRAPEVILSMEAKKPVDIDSKAADVYSFAMMCYEVITGKKPFQGYSYSTARELALGGGGPNLNNVNVCRDLKDLLKKCWLRIPEDRPKIDDVLDKLTAMSKYR